MARGLAAAEAVMQRGGNHPRVAHAKVTHVFEAEKCQPSWVRARVWDTTSDQTDCSSTHTSRLEGELRAPASKAMASHLSHRWTTAGRAHLFTVPARLPPKKVVAQDKWRLQDGGLVNKRKWRVTSDDSVAAPGSNSRNEMRDSKALVIVYLPAITKLAEAIVDVFKASATKAGVTLLGERGAERVALWALDLTHAYRELAGARHEWWMQQFVWVTASGS
ncbi:MAG: hypothetical protein SGPRY_010795 [Prymnesium sp.]